MLSLPPALAQRQGLSAGEAQHLTTLLTLYDITVVLQRNALSSCYSPGCITPVVEGFPHGEFSAYTSFCLALQQDNRTDIARQLDAHISKRKTAEDFSDDYLMIRYFQKGSAHIKFLRPEFVERMNDIVAKHYPGALPTKKPDS